MTGDAARPGEDALIARYFAPLAAPGARELRDDAACITPPPGHDLVLTADAVVAGVHFFPDDPADSIGWKALAVNLSDLAAKGADPLGFLLALALPPDWTADWLAGFASGLGAAAQAGRCGLLGGDTVMTPGPLTISITALGSVPAAGMVARTGARPGDRILVSGSIGDAALGLAARRNPDAAWLAAVGQGAAVLGERFLRPRPRWPLAAPLRRHASGGMDVSDGLVGDLAKMMRASGCGARVAVEAVPLSDAVRTAVAADPGLLATALTGGDDYEILATAPPAQADALRAAAAAAGVPMADVGVVTALAGEMIFLHNGRAVTFPHGSYSHF